MSTVAHTTSGDLTASPWIIPSVSPAGNQLLCLQLADASGMTVTAVSGNSQTWSQVTGAGGSNTSDWGGGNFREFVFEGIGTPSSGTITITVTGGDPYAITYQLMDVTGGNPSAVVVQSNKATGASTAPSVTLSAFDGSSDTTVGWCIAAAGGASTISPGTGFTELNEYRRGAFTADMATEWQAAADTTVDATFTGGSKTWYMYGFELSEATGGGSKPKTLLTLGIG